MVVKLCASMLKNYCYDCVVQNEIGCINLYWVYISQADHEPHPEMEW